MIGEASLASPPCAAVWFHMTKSRLSPDKWLTAGFEALVASGPSALAAEPLARALGTTKGSFYWHFKDVPAFQDALLAAWQVPPETVSAGLGQLGKAPARRGTPLGRGRRGKGDAAPAGPGPRARGGAMAGQGAR